MQKNLRLILWDHLTETLDIVQKANKETDTFLFCETKEEATHVKHHKKKLIFLFSAMRHFAAKLEKKGFSVNYIKYTDPKNTHSFQSELERLLASDSFDHILITHPGDYRTLSNIKKAERYLKRPITILEDTRFMTSIEDFKTWSEGKKQLRMEMFYRDMRKKNRVLMSGSQPEGGNWNYDAENRNPPKEGLKIPPPFTKNTDSITNTVIQMVEENFKDHFGDSLPFHFAVTREGALNVLSDFIEFRLPSFGFYQDAMIQDEPWMFHSHISHYINSGLLTPDECIDAAEEAYHEGDAPLNAVEGFIRQILGWREFVRGIYWLKMPAYKDENFLNASRNLPDFFWTAETKMNCLKQCISETKTNSYAHHIQRLMVLGNFCLIAGISPDEVNEWYLIVYSDAHEWVELPNVSGMILYADGGFLASKPYAASGAYINKMSNYCKKCTYKVSVKNGPDACPFNYLYWDFLIRNKDKLGKNNRLGFPYKTLTKMTNEKIKMIQDDSTSFLDSLK